MSKTPLSKTPIALVTGGTSGVGLSMVKYLLDQGFFVYFIGSNHARGTTLATDMNARGVRTEFVRLDLSDLPAVRAFATHLCQTVSHLDVLANVAGVLLPTRQQTATGLEKTLAIGHIGPFVLSTALVPALQRAPHGRIVNVSGASRGVRTQRLNWDDLNLERTYNAARAAMAAVHSKTVMTQLLSDKLSSAHIDVNAFHPGWVRSGLGRHLPWFLRWPFKGLQPVLSKTSRSGCFVCTSPRGTTGQLYVGERGSPLSFTPDYADAVWQWTVETCQRELGPEWGLPEVLQAQSTNA
ncbi:MAG: NAD(P)-dependent dehydrogenase (short-subunit alcohol dehydrogenase family) [Myxococcota bacterium]|jgi:NAD(P)-dependent dehydrogenase (short-subunit alcohol dehydrogenase family)